MFLPPSSPNPWPRLCKPLGRGSGDQLHVNIPEHPSLQGSDHQSLVHQVLYRDVEWVTAGPWNVSFPLTVVKSSGVRFSHLAVYCDESTQMGRAAMKPPQAHVLVHAHYTQPSCAPASSVTLTQLSLLTCGPGQLLGLWRQSGKWGTFSPSGCCELPVKTELFRTLSLLLLLEK